VSSADDYFNMQSLDENNYEESPFRSDRIGAGPENIDMRLVTKGQVSDLHGDKPVAPKQFQLNLPQTLQILNRIDQEKRKAKTATKENEEGL
jgi:hypothetical protein